MTSAGVFRTGVQYEHRWRGVARLAGVGAVAALAVVISLANRAPEHGAVHFCCGYTPARLAAGAWWTVPGSALLVPHLNLLGANTAVLVGVMVPYGLRAGSRRTLAAFFGGHILATLAVAAVVLPLAAWGWHPAEALRVRADVGASAGVAAVAGALAVSMRRRRWGIALLSAFGAFFGVSLLLFHSLADVEHLIALATGALLGQRWRTGGASRFIAGSWRHRQSGRGYQ
ncbi:MAG TPA: hypothetical protein VGR20_11255 [Acidimicrobiia bacterium]|nr:hypothetical protein [Acidimicrobiia bacterium]